MAITELDFTDIVKYLIEIITEQDEITYLLGSYYDYPAIISTNKLPDDITEDNLPLIHISKPVTSTRGRFLSQRNNIITVDLKILDTDNFNDDRINDLAYKLKHLFTQQNKHTEDVEGIFIDTEGFIIGQSDKNLNVILLPLIIDHF